MPLIEIYRAKIAPEDVARLLEIRADAVAEFQQQVPELVQAELVRLEGDVWLDVLTAPQSTTSASRRRRRPRRRARRCTPSLARCSDTTAARSCTAAEAHGQRRLARDARPGGGVGRLGRAVAVGGGGAAPGLQAGAALPRSPRGSAASSVTPRTPRTRARRSSYAWSRTSARSRGARSS